MARLTVKGVAEQLRKHHGVQAGVAKAFGVTRGAVTRYIDAHPELKDVQQEAEQGLLDLGETALYASVIKREPWAVKFLLATKGKGRGYVERSEVTGKDGGEVVIKVIYDDVDIDTAAPTFSAADSH